jgi:hypothetical protein
MISRLVLLGTVLMIGARDIRAQSVPLVSADFEVGRGWTSSRAGDTYFRESGGGMIEGDLTVRLGGPGATRPVIVAGYSSDVFAGDYTLDCPIAPNGGCKAWFPRTFGPTVGLGLRQMIGDRLMLGVTAGVASFTSHAEFGAAEASLNVFAHFALVGKFAYYSMPFEPGARVSFAPLTFGVRALW